MTRMTQILLLLFVTLVNAIMDKQATCYLDKYIITPYYTCEQENTDCFISSSPTPRTSCVERLQLQIPGPCDCRGYQQNNLLGNIVCGNATHVTLQYIISYTIPKYVNVTNLDNSTSLVLQNITTNYTSAQYTSNYAINVTWNEPDESMTCYFDNTILGGIYFLNMLEKRSSAYHNYPNILIIIGMFIAVFLKN